MQHCRSPLFFKRVKSSGTSFQKLRTIKSDWFLNILSTHREDTILWLVKICIFCSSLNRQMSKEISALSVHTLYYKMWKKLWASLKKQNRTQYLQSPLALYSFNTCLMFFPSGLWVLIHELHLTFGELDRRFRLGSNKQMNSVNNLFEMNPFTVKHWDETIPG